MSLCCWWTGQESFKKYIYVFLKGVFFLVIAMWFHLVLTEWTLCWILCSELFYVRESSKPILTIKDGSTGCLCQHVKCVFTSEFLQNQQQSTLTSSSIFLCFLLLFHLEVHPDLKCFDRLFLWETHLKTLISWFSDCKRNMSVSLL